MVYSTVMIIGLSLNFGQFDKPVAYRLRSLAGKPHLSDNLEQPHFPPHTHPSRAANLQCFASAQPSDKAYADGAEQDSRGSGNLGEDYF